MKVLLLCLMIVCLSWANKTKNPKHLKRVSCECGWRNWGRIVGGKATAKNEYPWMVSLNIGCGASIITQYHVLTAAHCTDGRNPHSTIVSVGKYYSNGPNQNMYHHRVYRFIQHPGYNRKSGRNYDDISVVVLASPIKFNKFVGPVCMPRHRYRSEGKYVKLTGWGITESRKPSNILRELDMKVVPVNVCKRSWPYLSHWGSQICSYTPRRDACNGDSGGPLVFLDPETRRYTQVALVSYGQRNCATQPIPSVNTDVFYYIGWINKAIQQRPRDNFCYKI